MRKSGFMNSYEMEEFIYEMMDEYRAKYNPYLKAWEAIAAISGISRNAVYNILGANKNARLDTIVRLASTLGMSHEDFIILLMYNGLCLRPFIKEERDIDEYFLRRDLGDNPFPFAA